MSATGHGQTKPSYRRLVLLLVTGLVALVSLSTVIQTQAMPVEARQTEPWYGYQSTIGFSFLARVRPGDFYSSPIVKADSLVRHRLPVEPPQFRRILISQFTEAIEVSIPYSYKADREAKATAILTAEAMLVVPNLWQKPFPLNVSKTFEIKGTELSGVEKVTIPIAALLSEIEAAKTQHQISLEPMEILIRPVFEVKVEGLRQPVAVLQNPEFRIGIRRDVVEVDDPRDVKAEKQFTETRVVPITVNVFGNEVTVGALRRVSLVTLGVSLTLVALLLWYRKRKQDPRLLLEKLGPSLIIARSFELPSGTAMADVHSAKELLQLHAQTERPVILVDQTAYLLDGTTCYRLVIREGEQKGPPPEPEAPAWEQLLPEGVIPADSFTLDPWITEVQVHTLEALKDLRSTTGRAIIRTSRGYHLLDGSVCFTVKLPEPVLQAAAAEQTE